MSILTIPGLAIPAQQHTSVCYPIQSATVNCISTTLGMYNFFDSVGSTTGNLYVSGTVSGTNDMYYQAALGSLGCAFDPDMMVNQSIYDQCPLFAVNSDMYHNYSYLTGFTDDPSVLVQNILATTAIFPCFSNLTDMTLSSINVSTITCYSGTINGSHYVVPAWRPLGATFIESAVLYYNYLASIAANCGRDYNYISSSYNLFSLSTCITGYVNLGYLNNLNFNLNSIPVNATALTNTTVSTTVTTLSTTTATAPTTTACHCVATSKANKLISQDLFSLFSLFNSVYIFTSMFSCVMKNIF